jgi:cytochrome P450
MPYLSMCIQETLRLEPSVQVTSTIELSETQDLAGVTFKKGTQIMIDIYHLHNNPDEWITPSQYIPERFDPESPFYLTPYGNKRHPMSYGPFLGGKRICLGKTFAENMGKSMTALIIG